MMAARFVNQRERLGTARRIQEIVTADAVVYDREHRPAAVRVEDVAGGEVDGVVVVERPARRQPFVRVGASERHEIRHLLAARVDDARAGAGRQLEADAALRRDSRARHSSRSSLAAAAWNGHFHPASTCRPEYWDASERSPNSPSIGLMSPCSATSPARITR